MFHHMVDFMLFIPIKREVALIEKMYVLTPPMFTLQASFTTHHVNL